MHKFCYYLILSLVAVNGNCQNDTIRKYLDENLSFCKKKEATYDAMAVKTDKSWMLYAYYPDSSLLLKIFYKDAALQIKDGMFAMYYPKGLAKQAGYYKNDIPNGVWESWYFNQQKMDSGKIVNNRFEGEWKNWYENGNLSFVKTYASADIRTSSSLTLIIDPNLIKRPIFLRSAPQGILNGCASRYYENGNPASIENYQMDTLSGNCTYYRLDGTVSTKETYVQGKLEALSCFNEKGEYTGATCSVLKLPILVHPFFTVFEYIVDQLHRTKNNDIREEGEAVISFRVLKNGKADSLVIKRSADEALSDHIRKIFSTLPSFSPAITHNRPVDYPVELTIPFYRNKEDKKLNR